MKDLLLFLATSLATTVSKSVQRTATKLAASPALLQPGLIHTIHSQTGDVLHVGECKENEVTYGLISFNLRQPITDLADAQLVLQQFITDLQSSFAITHTIGAVADADDHPQVKALVDYWQDSERKDWKVKGWTDGTTIAVLYIKNIGQAHSSSEDLFLNEGRFTAA